MQPTNSIKIGVLLFIISFIFFGVAAQAGCDPSATKDSVKLGKQVYNKCIGCHSMDRNRTGPMHCGIIGRKAGSVENYSYSKVLASSDIIWTRKTLNDFIRAPFEFMPGTSMGFSGIKDENKRLALIDYLIASKDSGECLQ